MNDIVVLVKSILDHIEVRQVIRVVSPENGIGNMICELDIS